MKTVFAPVSGLIAILVSLLPLFSSGQDLTTGLLAYYPFSGNANDATGSGNNGTLVNGPILTTDRAGTPNSAYLFDGIDDYISIPGGANINPADAMSVALYFYPTKRAVQSMFGKCRYSDNQGIQWQVAMDFSLYPGAMWGVNSTSGCTTNHLNDSYTNSVGLVPLNQWHCLVGTFDRGVQMLYLDGNLVSTVNTPFSTLSQYTVSGIQIGSWWANDGQFFEGKIDEVRIYDRALTQTDVSALCPLSCPTMAGTLTGSNTCNDAPGLLTFHSATGTGAGPFTIGYSDGVNTYTQNDVKDGEPFATKVKPTVSTIYTLQSIRDDVNGCQTTVPPGISATINPGNCTLCTGSLGDPIINIDFGSGPGNSPPLEIAIPGARSVNLTYSPVSGNPATPTTLDGEYTITNNVPYNTAWFMGGQDHTPNDVDGYMLFENPGLTPGEFYQQKMTDLCGGTKYEFAAWIAVADNPAVVTAVLPDLTFIVQTEDGTVLDVYNSGPISQLTTWTWRQYGFFFTLPPGISTVVIRIIDNNPGGGNNPHPGNDFALDDITFRPCGPASTSSSDPHSLVPQLNVCEGGGGAFYGAVAPGGYTNPQYLWQNSSDSGRTWTDLPSSNTLTLPVTAPVTGKLIDYYYRMLAAEGNNIQSPKCRVASSISILHSKPLPGADFAFVQDVCSPLQVKFSGASQTGVIYTWNIEGADHTMPGSADLTWPFSGFGDFPIILKVTDGFCPNSSTKTISIRTTPADIINTKDTTLCAGLPVPLSAKPALEFCWSPTTGLDNPASANPVATPPATTKYYFTAKFTGSNLIVNGDFSNGNTGFSSAYTYDVVNQNEGEYFVGTSPNSWNPKAPVPCGDHTNGNGNMLLINGNPIQGVNVWSEQITIQPNMTYAFSTWIQSISPFSPAILQFSINGTPLGAAVNASSTTCTWQQFYTTWNSGSSTTATISLVNQNTAALGNDFALDDIAFSPLTMLRDSVTITVNPLPMVEAKPDTTICPGIPAPLRVTGADTYSWSPASTLSDASSANPIATPDVTTEYIVKGTTLQGCSANDTIDVALFYPPYIRISSDTAVCNGDNIRLHIDAGTGATYTWSPAPLLDDPTSTTPLASLTTDTLFRVSITDGNSCIENDSVKVYIRPTPVFVQPLDLSICEGFFGILGRNDYIHYVYSWLPATDLDDPTAPRPVVTPISSEQYTVMISDSTCPRYNSSFLVNVTVKPSPVITAYKAHDIDCSQPTTQLNVTGGRTYSWFPPIGLSDSTSESPTVSTDSTTKYYVKGTAFNGCYAVDSVTVNVKAIGKNLFVVPNAFSPNGDGHNDCYGIQRWGDVEVEEFSVFNRWGVRVFTARNPSQCWDGTFNGHPQPADNYIYVIRAKTFCGPVTRTGNLILVR